MSPVEVRQEPEPIIVISEDRFFMAFAEDETEELRWMKLSGTHIFNQEIDPCFIPNHLIGVVIYQNSNLAMYLSWLHFLYLYYAATFVSIQLAFKGVENGNSLISKQASPLLARLCSNLITINIFK
ncbi:Hypothetical_protein [Hexamita inflata]|uniref:Hypothetical_protein n=1 Tax=Hexamita inflata TaxID=28002 RepID=A0AA86Q8J4_9EUKA|nr:Hypothetical protein HINF_LOCUS40211 [Hexamita inflata]